jgi:hypothetical protein
MVSGGIEIAVQGTDYIVDATPNPCTTISIPPDTMLVLGSYQTWCRNHYNVARQCMTIPMKNPLN